MPWEIQILELIAQMVSWNSSIFQALLDVVS